MVVIRRNVVLCVLAFEEEVLGLARNEAGKRY